MIPVLFSVVESVLMPATFLRYSRWDADSMNVWNHKIGLPSIFLVQFLPYVILLEKQLLDQNRNVKAKVCNLCTTQLNNDCFQTEFPNTLLLVDSPALNSHHWLSRCCCCQASWEDPKNSNFFEIASETQYL